MSVITSTINLLAQIIIIFLLAKGIGYIPSVKLREHGRLTLVSTLILLVSIASGMISKFIEIYGLLAITVLRIDFSNSLANLLFVHIILGLSTLIPAIYISIDWARTHFSRDVHEGSLRMWWVTVAWIITFLLGVWLYLSLYYFA